ncbi:MAG TPA: TetR/AcrR family transcriptional regulator [Marmoricola sp.]|nr:TetR/AcrR family transcriptional regulator [Marmoricola sp.]
MSSRAAAKERTRAAILEAAHAAFAGRWFDEVTMADVAAAAGVSQQTVVNHFGSKMGLYLAGVAELVAPRIQAARDGVEPGDVAAVVDAVLDDYAETGDGTVRTEALALRDPDLAEVVAGGRRAHRLWVEQVFAPQLADRTGSARERLVTLLALALDAGTWHRLRRAQGLGRTQVRGHLVELVDALLGTPER